MPARTSRQLADLAGKKVNVDVAGSGTAMTASTLFGALGTQGRAHQLRPGAGPGEAEERRDRGDGLRRRQADRAVPQDRGRQRPALRPIPLTARLAADLSAIVADPRRLSDAGRREAAGRYGGRRRGNGSLQLGAERTSDTGAWPPSWRPSSTVRRVPETAAAPKWQEVNLAAELPGWTRFPAAQEWLDRRPTTAGAGYDLALKNSFEEFLAFINETSGRGGGDPQSREALFAHFLEWRAARSQAQPAGTTTFPPAPASAPR